MTLRRCDHNFPRLLCLAMVCAVINGCANTNWVKVRQKPNLPLATELDLFSWWGPKPSGRTQQFLRRYGLVEKLKGDPRKLLEEIQVILQRAPSAENVYAYAELAYIGGKKLQDDNKIGDALDLYAASVAQSYEYLLGSRLDFQRNPYDPLFRKASDIYNGALENALRIVRDRGQLKPGVTHEINTPTQQFEIRIVARGRWHPEEFAKLEFVSDYKITGLRNHYRTYGLGVPLIAVHSGKPKRHPATKYYAPGMSFPVTAFLRVLPDSAIRFADGKSKHICMLELFDPLEDNQVPVHRQMVPLETDLSTPLAYSLNNPTLQEANVATRGFFNVEKSSKVQGLYMLEPFDPDKVPVLMTHGLFSNLITWMEMFNDLRGHPQIRDNFQFWFYLYPTGQPFWLTAAQLRAQLQETYRRLDPHQQNIRFNQLVLVGHSMGGLISRMQTIESRDRFWNMVADQPIDEVDAPLEVRESLRSLLYFQPNPSIQRVVTIASPHRGSNFSNDATQWLSRRVIRFPKALQRTKHALFETNDQIFKKDVLEMLETSIDTLSPQSPILPLLVEADSPPWVRHHNIVGVLDSKVLSKGDGVVSYESAHLRNVDSEVAVEADHVTIHQKPKTILEVQRILLEHLTQVRFAERRLNNPRMSRLPPVEPEMRR